MLLLDFNSSSEHCRQTELQHIPSFSLPLSLLLPLSDLVDGNSKDQDTAPKLTYRSTCKQGMPAVAIKKEQKNTYVASIIEKEEF